MLLDYGIIICSVLILIEIIAFFWIRWVRGEFQWLIISSDKKPNLSHKDLEKFFEHGFDEELGWVRKSNTNHEEKGKEGTVKWTTNEIGARTNPNFDSKKPLISCYGDSFTFCRQVNDNQTWEHFLSESLNQNVVNFGVGNHGIDQSLMRIKREFPKNRTKIVILGVVPDTISRILSCWKHYCEYGNTFAFKPRYKIQDDELVLVKNFINKKEKFSTYSNYLKTIQENDYFYNKKFKKEIITFPYSLTIFKNPKRNFGIIFWITRNFILKNIGISTKFFDWKPMQIIMKINLKLRISLFHDESAIKLFQKIISAYIEYAKQENFIPIFTLLPQKDDLLSIKKSKNFVKEFSNELKNMPNLHYIDIIEKLLDSKHLDNMYSDDNDYGGHFSEEGNKIIAKIIKQFLEEEKIIHEV
jgi:hypothetical protein|tara:strand:- start:619 stop:1860 length:1242 start_codon:yes stop_codon:yes gene_type:complete